jgi:pimeloyl-ACP methyl ester carboxylesterase
MTNHSLGAGVSRIAGAADAVARGLRARSSAAIIVLPVVLALAACGGGGDGSPTLSDITQKVACATLQGMSVPASSIGLATTGATILSAVDVTDTDVSGGARSYCKVTGNILPVDATAAPIRFQVNLPKTWNQRALQFGGGGTNGTVVTGLNAFSGAPAGLATPLARGYVTLGSDSGHDSAGKPPFDTSFALNQEQLMNFGQYQIKKTVDVAKWLTQQMYGQKPRYTYFAGGSQGGHEGFDAAQRYPDDYEGVIAHYPAYNVINMWMGSQAQAQAIYGNKLGVASAAWMNPAKVASVVAYVLSQCDSLDGIADGIISDVRACNAKVTIASVKVAMRCPDGTDTGDSCLSDAQLGALAKIASPVQFSFAFAGGSTTYPRWPILEGGHFLSNHLGKTNTADLNKVPFVADGSAFQLFPAKGGIQGFITQDLTYDPLAFDVNAWVSRIQQVSGWTDATSVNLSRFSGRGGKLLLSVGTIDDSISPHNTINYWQKLVAANTQATVDTFARFYLIPGQGHGEGIFRHGFDWLTALEQWVEQGNAPANLVAKDQNTTAGTSATNGRTRPLCLYGSWPKYTGPASPAQAQANDAANFTCTAY